MHSFLYQMRNCYSLNFRGCVGNEWEPSTKSHQRISPRTEKPWWKPSWWHSSISKWWQLLNDLCRYWGSMWVHFDHFLPFWFNDWLCSSFGDLMKLTKFRSWNAVGTPYEGGVFRMKLILCEDFPLTPPKGDVLFWEFIF